MCKLVDIPTFKRFSLYPFPLNRGRFVLTNKLLPRLSHKGPCSFFLDHLVYSLSRCFLLRHPLLETSHHTAGSPSHMESPHGGALVDNPSWTLLLSHPILGTRNVASKASKWVQKSSVPPAIQSSWLRFKTLKNRNKSPQFCLTEFLAQRICSFYCFISPNCGLLNISNMLNNTTWSCLIFLVTK